VLADEDLDVIGESSEAGVEVAGDPVRAGFGDALGRLCGVVAFVVAEERDLRSVALAA
jgi:hypothetical protein